jgi:hypothetical protein
LGIGDWGLGIGDWGLGPIPNPQSPIPNPQSPYLSSSSTFEEIVQKFDIFVDKSLFIKEIISSSEDAILITRPRRWGKTMNIDMLKTFLEVDGNNPEKYDNNGKYDFIKENKNAKFFKGGKFINHTN